MSNTEAMDGSIQYLERKLVKQAGGGCAILCVAQGLGVLGEAVVRLVATEQAARDIADERELVRGRLKFAEGERDELRAENEALKRIDLMGIHARNRLRAELADAIRERDATESVADQQRERAKRAERERDEARNACQEQAAEIARLNACNNVRIGYIAAVVEALGLSSTLTDNGLLESARGMRYDIETLTKWNTTKNERVRVLETTLRDARQGICEIYRHVDEDREIKAMKLCKPVCDRIDAALTPAPPTHPLADCGNIEDCKVHGAPPAETPAPTAFEVCQRCGQHHPAGMTTHRDFNGDWCSPPAPTRNTSTPEARDDANGVWCFKCGGPIDGLCARCHDVDIDRLRAELAAANAEIARLREPTRLTIAYDQLVEAHAVTAAKLGRAVAALRPFAEAHYWECHTQFGRSLRSNPRDPAEVEAARAILADTESKAACEAWAALVAKAALLDAPEIHDFTRAVVLEAAHQRSRWDSNHDAGKTDADWFWLIGYLAGKALHNPRGNCPKCAGAGELGCSDSQCGDSTWDHHCDDGRACDACGGMTPDKLQLHRIITVAAAACNWHAAKLGKTTMRPGIEPPTDDNARRDGGAK